MISKERGKKIISIGWPVIVGMLSVNLLLIVDTIMLGKLGASALTAVGIGGVLYSLVLTLIAGLSTAVQSMTGWRMGAEDHKNLLNPLLVGVVCGIVLGIPGTILVLKTMAWAVTFYTKTPTIIEGATDYLGLAIFGLVGVGINTAFRGFWNGLGRTKVYMTIIMSSHVVNIIFNFLLIFGLWGFPRLEIKGAAIASVIAIYTSTCLYLIVMIFDRKTPWSKPKWSWDDFKTLWRLSWPINMRGIVSSVGMILIFRMISVLGDNVLAAMTVLGRLTQILFLPAMGLGMATATLVAQALGRNDLEDARRWGWDGAKIGGLILLGVGLPFALFPETALHIFIQEKEIVAMARAPMILTGLSVVLGFGALILPQALSGAGDTLRISIVAVSLEWLLLMPGIYLVAPVLKLNLLAISSVYLLHTAAAATIFIIIWHRGKWQTIKR